jgi:alkylhydroperoxidase/carboxymuconolactone decarboxylase family protein YurZ
VNREDLRRQGDVMRDKLQGGAPDLPNGFGTLLTEAVFGGIWPRPGLALPDRLVCALAAVSVQPRLLAVRRLIGAALDAGLATEAVREVLVQAGLYTGFTAAEETLSVAAEVFASRGLPFPPDPPADASLDMLTERGHALMHELHGARAQSGYAAPDNPVTGALYPMAIQYGYGEIWFRPGLDRRRRALVAVAAFTALRLPEQVAKFGQSALNAGLTRTEVIEAVIQTAPLSGFPPALNALAALAPVFA